MRVQPNPSTGTFHLTVSGSGMLRIWDMQGREILQRPLQAGSHSLFLSQSGLYLLRFERKGYTPELQKVIIE